MFKIRLSSLVLISLVLVSQAHGMRCVHGRYAQNIHASVSKNKPTREMIMRGWEILQSKDDTKVLGWCQILVGLGLNPSVCFGEWIDSVGLFIPIHLVTTVARYAMPKTLEYLLNMHVCGLDCGIGIILPEKRGKPKGKMAGKIALKYVLQNHSWDDYGDCVRLLEEAIEKELQKRMHKANL